MLLTLKQEDEVMNFFRKLVEKISQKEGEAILGNLL